MRLGRSTWSRLAVAAALAAFPARADHPGDVQLALDALRANHLAGVDKLFLKRADRDGADQVEREIEAMKSLSPARDWDPPVLRTVAAQGEGVASLLAAIRAHDTWLRAHGGLARKARERARLRFESLLAEASLRRAKAQAGPDRLEAAVRAIAEGHADPYAAVADILGGT